MRFGISALKYIVYLLMYAGFAVGAASVTVLCLALFWLPDNDRVRRWFRRVIHAHFRLWITYLTGNRLFHVRFVGFEAFPRDTGLIVVSNHPGLMDITYLLAAIPDALCIFKPQIRRNPILGATARRAGYLASDGGIDLVRYAAEAAAAGHTLIIFPEGTRTRVGRRLNSVKPGFALIAQRAKVPVQLVSIACDSALASKDHPWWILPKLPAHITVTLGPLLAPPPTPHIEPLVEEATAWLDSHALPVPA